MESLIEWFDDLSKPKEEKEVVFEKYPMVHFEDSEPVTVVGVSVARGPWIAGGACLHWYQNIPVGESDIDVYCLNARQASDTIDRIKSYGRWTKRFESDNATTLDYWNKDRSKQWTIQVITKRYYSSLQEVIDSFDISVCQIATDGNNVCLGEHTARDVRERNLRMQMPLMPDAAKRLIKYWTYGYRPVDGLLEAVQNNPVGRWEYTPEEDYR